MNSEILEYLDNNGWEKSQYMELIRDIMRSYWMSKIDMDVIENAIYSYESSK
jgi:hypothetical protein